MSSPDTALAGAALIELRGVGKAYFVGGQDTTVLRDVTLDIHAGEFVAIVGASGSGKTTLMNLIGCLDTPSVGSYRFDGDDLSELSGDELAAHRRDSIGFVFQRYNLLANASALENVEIPAVYAGAPAGQRRHRALELLATLGLSERSAHRPNQLSGGQQQRVCIARALMNGARLILADEPTGALDSRSGAEVMRLLHALNRRGHTVILVTHDAALAQQARRRIVLEDGRVVADSGSVAKAASENLPPLPLAGEGRGEGRGMGHPPALTPALSQRQKGTGVSLDEVLDAIQMALRALRANLFRSSLTLLGVIIGVGAVVAMLALGEGTQRAVLARIEAMGTNLLIVRPGARGVRISGESTTLVAEDAAAIAQLRNVVHAVPEYTAGATLRVNDSDYAANVTGTTAEFAATRDWPLESGQFLTPTDVSSFAPVAVLGQTVAANLFGRGVDPVGARVLIANIPFQVIGVLSTKGASSSGSDMDDVVLVPLTTSRVRLFGKRHLRSIIVEVDDKAQLDATQAEIRTLLTLRHRREDFQLRNMADVLDAAEQTQTSLTWLLGSVAAISLLVGGIGVMNVMLVSVTERVREIGLRMAVGARVANIMLQFNIEALVVCCIGGALGVAGGLGAVWLAGEFGRDVVFSLPPVLIAFTSAVLTGLVFGFLPARRAATLDPVLALSAE
jgi:macrolide transport system ATP-binding/permease protein